MLKAWSGDREAAERFMPVIYDELRRQAHRFLNRERPNHTLQTTALVHEAYLRLIEQNSVNWQNRAHFWFGGVNHAADSRQLRRQPEPSPSREATGLSGFGGRRIFISNFDRFLD